MFAVVEIAGKQYTVSKGATIVVDRVDGKVGDTVKFDRVFLIHEGKTSRVGTPTLAKASVTAKITAQGRGEKIDVRRFKSKVRERRHIGFRPQITTLEILSINPA